MKCIKCGNFVPENAKICPFCGEKIEAIENTENKGNEDQTQEENKELSKQLNWFDFSVEVIKENWQKILIISLINNPIFWVLSLGLVSSYNYSLLYNFSISFINKNTKMDFSYSKDFLNGLKILAIHLLTLIPFIIILIILTGILIFSFIQAERNYTYALFFFLSYIISIFYLIFFSSFYIVSRYFVIISLIEREKEKIDTWNLIIQTYRLMIKNAIISILLIFILLVIFLAVQNLIGILCYCTCGIVFFFVSFPYLIVDIFFMSFLLDQYNKGKIKIV